MSTPQTIHTIDELNKKLSHYIKHYQHGSIGLRTPALYSHIDLCQSCKQHQLPESASSFFIQKSPYHFHHVQHFLKHLNQQLKTPYREQEQIKSFIHTKYLLTMLEEHTREYPSIIWLPYADIVCQHLSAQSPKEWPLVIKMLTQIPHLYIIAFDTNIFSMLSWTCQEYWQYLGQEKPYTSTMSISIRDKACLHQAVQQHPLLFQKSLQHYHGIQDVSSCLKITFDTLSPWYFSQIALLSPQMGHILDQALREPQAFSIQEIAQALSLPVTTVSSQINRLIKQGYIRPIRNKIPRKYRIQDTLMNLWRQWTFEENPEVHSTFYWDWLLSEQQLDSIALTWPEGPDLLDRLYEQTRIPDWQKHWKNLQKKIQHTPKTPPLPATIQDHPALLESLWLPQLTRHDTLYQTLSADLDIILILSEMDLLMTAIIGSPWAFEKAKQYRQKKIDIYAIEHIENILSDEEIEPLIQIFLLFIATLCHPRIILLKYCHHVQEILAKRMITPNLHALCSVRWAQIAFYAGNYHQTQEILKNTTRTNETSTAIDILRFLSALQKHDLSEAKTIITSPCLSHLTWETDYRLLYKSHTEISKEEIKERFLQLIQHHPHESIIQKSYSFYLLPDREETNNSLHYAMSALCMTPHDAELLWHIALLEYQLNDHTNTEKHLKEAHQENTNNMNILFSYIFIQLINHPYNIDAPVQMIQQNIYLKIYNALIRKNYGELDEVITESEEMYPIILRVAQMTTHDAHLYKLYRTYLSEQSQKHGWKHISLLCQIIENKPNNHHLQYNEILRQKINNFLEDKRQSLLMYWYLENNAEKHQNFFYK